VGGRKKGIEKTRRWRRSKVEGKKKKTEKERRPSSKSKRKSKR
jgi:hypothetical protein